MGGAAVFGARDVSDLTRSVLDAVRRVLSYDDLARPERGEIQLLLGRLLRDVGQEPAAFDAIEAAVGHLDDRPELAGPAMSTLGMPLVPHWPGARHRTWLARATELLPRIASPSDRLRVTTNRASALLLLGEEEGWRAADEIRRTADSVTEHRLLARFLFNVGQIAITWGRYAEARSRLTAAAELVAETGYGRLTATVRVPFVYLDFCTGNWAGLDETAAALAADRNANPYGTRLVRQIRAVLALATGDGAKARRELREIAGELAETGLCEPEAGLSAAALARSYVADGEWEAALDVTGRVVGLAAHKDAWLWATDVLAPRLDALTGTGRLDRAERLLRRYGEGTGTGEERGAGGIGTTGDPGGGGVEATGERHTGEPLAGGVGEAAGTGTGGERPTDRTPTDDDRHADGIGTTGRRHPDDTHETDPAGHRHAPAAAAASTLGHAILAEARGDLGRAAGGFGVAASLWAQLPRPYDELLALERRGRCLVRLGDVDGALVVLGGVQERLWALGARTDADRVARLLREHGVEVSRPWRRGPRGYGSRLSPRERQVVALVARGLTNRAAAEALFVSPKTVATQLSSAMRKLGVSSRTAVVRAAVETGVLALDSDEFGESAARG
ncbi:helix-turn-helix transcriptional regulator [Streptomyces sp. NPDC004539]|uniref:helix-turn-helix transcriptional regulator n=1 Tax=Streptomyces sp. NPDC004539 TaxID=3154280 RepID=UPI0033AEE918